jgi:hypothetical protein
MLASPLCDVSAFARGMEDALLALAQKCAGGWD